MTKSRERAPAAEAPLAPRIIGYAGCVLSGAALIGCGALAVLGLRRGEAGGALLLGGLLFLLVSWLGWAMFRDFLRLRDWMIAPEVPLGLKVLGHLGRIAGSLGAASCIALVVMTVALSKPPRPGLAAIYLLGVFVALLVRMLGSAISELRTWARPGSLVAAGLAVALLVVALILNLTRWGLAEATLPLALFLGASALLFLFLLVYFMLPPVVEAFESRRL